MKLDWFRKKDGAVTVFLAIILIPVILLCAIYIDLSRVKLSEAQVQASGDLAMNTLLTNYDTELSDLYGMMASVQDIDKFYDDLEDYFELSLKSQGYDASTAANYAAGIKGIVKDSSKNTDKISDMLQMEIVGDTGFDVHEEPNSNLANPAMVKTNIVEFMKYRSPANAALSLFNMLNDSSEDLEKANQNTKLLDDRKKYYESEGKIMDDCHQIYEKMVEYNNLGIDEKFVEDMRASVDAMKDKYKEYTKRVVKDLYNTENLKALSFPSLDASAKKKDLFGDEKGKRGLADGEDFDRKMQDVSTALKEYKAARDEVKNTINSVDTNGVYDMQYWVKMAELFKKSNNKLSKYGEKVRALKEAVEILNSAKDNNDGTVFDGVEYSYQWASSKATRDTHYNNLINDYNSCNSDYTNGFYSQFKSKMGTIYNNYNPKRDRAAFTEELKKDVETIKALRDTCEKGAKIMTKVIDLLETLLKDLRDAKANYGQWEKDANNYSTEMAESDKEKFDNKKIQSDFMKYITEDNINKFSTRCSKVKELLNTYVDAIDDIKFYNKSILKITKYSTFEDLLNIDESKIVLSNSELDSYANSLFNNGNFTIPDKLKTGITSSNNPDFSKNSPTLYKEIMKHFEDYDPNQKDEGEKEKKEYEKKTVDESKDSKSESKTSSPSKNNVNDKSFNSPLPSSIKFNPSEPPAGADDKAEDAADNVSKDLSKTSDVLSSMFGGFGEILKKAGITVRDDLYSVDYITSMFSFDTMELEAKDQNEIDGKTDTKVVFKTLTNKEINATNNYSYLNEVEYIMYGGKNSANKAKAYATILLVRLALDLPAVFAYYYGEETIVDALAAAIAVATWDIIPEPLAKFIIVLAILLTEASCDVAAIKKGKRVLLIKEKKDLVVNPETFMSKGLSAFDAAADKDEKRLTLRYSGYLKIFLFVKLLNSSSADKIYQRTADVIQANIRHQGTDGYEMDKAFCYFTIKCDIEVDATMLGSSLFSSFENTPATLTDWRTLKYTCTRGY